MMSLAEELIDRSLSEAKAGEGRDETLADAVSDVLEV